MLSCKIIRTIWWTEIPRSQLVQKIDALSYTEHQKIARKICPSYGHIADDSSLQGCYAVSFGNSRCFQIQTPTLQPYFSNINTNIGPSGDRSFKWTLPLHVFDRETVFGKTRRFMIDVDRWQRWRGRSANATVGIAASTITKDNYGQRKVTLLFHKCCLMLQ